MSSFPGARGGAGARRVAGSVGGTEVGGMWTWESRESGGDEAFCFFILLLNGAGGARELTRELLFSKKQKEIRPMEFLNQKIKRNREKLAKVTFGE